MDDWLYFLGFDLCREDNSLFWHNPVLDHISDPIQSTQYYPLVSTTMQPNGKKNFQRYITTDTHNGNMFLFCFRLFQGAGSLFPSCIFHASVCSLKMKGIASFGLFHFGFPHLSSLCHWFERHEEPLKTTFKRGGSSQPTISWKALQNLVQATAKKQRGKATVKKQATLKAGIST